MQPSLPKGRLKYIGLLPAVFAVGFVFLSLYLFRAVLGPFIFAIVLVYLMEPVVQRLNFRGTFGFHWPRWLAIVSLYLTLVSSMVLFVVLAIPTLSVEMTRLAREMPTIVQDIRVELEDVTTKVEGFLADGGLDSEKTASSETLETMGQPTAHNGLPEPAFTLEPLEGGRYAIRLGQVDILAEEARGGYSITLSAPEEQEKQGGLDIHGMVDEGFDELIKAGGARIGEAVSLARMVAEGIFGSIISVVLTLMIAAFISIDLEGVLAYFRKLIPPKAQQTGDLLLTKLDRRLSGVIRGQLIICLVNGALTYFILSILGMRFVFLLSVIATAFTLIPIFGMLISSVPALAIALMDGGLEQVVMVFIGIMFIHFLEANIFNPKIIGSSAKIHPVLVIFALLGGEHAFGLLGALLAAPTMAIALTLVQFALEASSLGVMEPAIVAAPVETPKE